MAWWAAALGMGGKTSEGWDPVVEEVRYVFAGVLMGWLCLMRFIALASHAYSYYGYSYFQCLFIPRLS